MSFEFIWVFDLYGFSGLSGFMYRDTSTLNAGCVMNNHIRKPVRKGGNKKMTTIISNECAWFSPVRMGGNRKVEERYIIQFNYIFCNYLIKLDKCTALINYCMQFNRITHLTLHEMFTGQLLTTVLGPHRRPPLERLQ